jgi:hypothetical protein
MMRQLTPSASRSARLAMAGLVWTAVGTMLIGWAARWLLYGPRAWVAVAGLSGAGIGLFAWRALFARLASDNAGRILRGSARACLFGFTAPKGWVVTVAMVMFGSLLRHSSLPKTLLAVPYSAIGVALLLASLTYYMRISTTFEGAKA